MKLANFQIKNYKVIADTESVKVDPRVTALVGKNESGKTAVLKAMWKTRNVASATFDKLYDYPRDRYSRDRKSTQEVTVLEFGLSSEEVDDLVAEVDQLTDTEPIRITYTTFYEGEDQVRQEVQISGLGAAATGAEARAAVENLSKAIEEQTSEDDDSVRTSCTSALNRYFPDNLQACGNHTLVAWSREQNVLRRHPMT